MKEEVNSWLKQAKEDINTAQFNYNGGKFKFAAFLCHQSVEKSFKALLIKRTGRLRKIHDLVELGRSINAPPDLLEEVKELTIAYLYTRYPDVKEVINIKDKTEKFLKTAKKAIQWVNKKI